MAAQPDPHPAGERGRLVRIRSDDWPERDRAAMFRELHGGDQIRLEPAAGEPLLIDATLVLFPDLLVLRGRRSPLRSEFADGHDRLVINLGGPAVATSSAARSNSSAATPWRSPDRIAARSQLSERGASRRSRSRREHWSGCWRIRGAPAHAAFGD